MTTTHPDDEHLSAYLDGEAGVADAAHVEGCETCGTRLEGLRRAMGAVAAAPPGATPVGRDRAIAAALQQVGSPGVAAARPGSAGREIRRRPSRIPVWLGAAAAVVLVALIVPHMSFGGGEAKKASSAAVSAGTNNPSATTSTTAAAATQTTIGPRSFGSATATTAKKSTTATTTPDLGDVSDSGRLVVVTATLRGSPDARSTAKTPATPSNGIEGSEAGAPGCVAAAAAVASNHGIEAPAGFRAALRWQGRPATVSGFALAGGGTLLVVTDATSCTVLATTTA